MQQYKSQIPYMYILKYLHDPELFTTIIYDNLIIYKTVTPTEPIFAPLYDIITNIVTSRNTIILTFLHAVSKRSESFFYPPNSTLSH